MSDNNRPHVEADPSALRVARVYAEALLDLGWKRHAGQDFLESLEDLVNHVLAPNPALAEFFASRAITSERKADVIRSAFGGRSRDDFIDFLLVVNDHDRLDLLRPILDEYRQLYDARLNRVRVRVTSATPLGDDQRARLADELKQLIKKEPILEARVDPALIGGLIVRVGDYEYDSSVRTELQLLRDYLIERSSHEITRG